MPAGLAKPLEIPQPLVAHLVQNNEAMLKQVAAKTGASLTLRQDTRNFGYSLVLFAGSPVATVNARNLLQQTMGLGTGQTTTRTIELLSQNSTAFSALAQVAPAIAAKYGNMGIKLLAPERIGVPFRVQIGPGTVAHISSVEAQLRRSLREIELEIYSKSKRAVPPEIKYAMMCKNTRDGIPCPNIGCPFCHTEKELEIASRCCWENVTKPSELRGGDQPVQLSLTPHELKETQAPKPAAQPESTPGTSGLL